MFKSCLKVAAATLGAFSLISLSACSSEEPAVSSTPSTSEKSDIRSVEDACNIALAFLEAGNDISASRSEDAIANVKIGYGATSRSGAADTLFYSVNLANDGGFVLVSAPTSAEPVLAYVENGSYDPAQTTDNPGFNMFMEKAKEYISISSVEPGSPGGPVIVKKPYTLVRDAKPKVNVGWGQRFPEGTLCPNGKSGCVQTAMAMILSYFQQPTAINLTYPERDRDIVNLNWAEIKKHTISPDNEFDYNNHLDKCEASEENHKALAYLCRELGHRNNATYKTLEKDGKIATVAFDPDAYSLFKTLLPGRKLSRYEFFNSNYFDDLISNLTTNSAVAYFSGVDNASGGHVWVCGGGRHYEYHTEMYFANGEEDVRNTYYFFFNWGSYGYGDGYFLGDVYNPDKSLQEDELPPTTNLIIPMSRANFSERVHFFMIY